MSRRKQEKPQPRKNLIKGEACDPGVDLLRCGACQRDFPLCEIVRFIQHKARLCPLDKENCGGDADGDEEGEDEEEDALKRERVDEEVSSSSLLKRAFTKDTSVDTTANCNAEPRSYVCSTCKQSLTSAWALILHVQGLHGLSICAYDSAEETGKDSPRAPLRPSRAGNELRLDLLGKQPPAMLLEQNQEPPLQDFYSQRLRVLAGATSPSQQKSPLFKPLLSNGHKNESMSSSSPSPPEKQPPALNGTDSPASSTTGESPKNRLCEYCGKSFLFESNLVVHRRSHTGERPFKCHVCEHACTQASKLKRHMKTHRKRAQVNGGLPNGKTNGDLSSPPHTNGDLGYSENEDDLDEDLDDDDEELNVDCIEEERNLVIDHSDEEDEEAEDMVAEDLTKKTTPNGNHPVGSENGNSTTSHSLKHSVVGEFMEKIGFSHIPQYNEAYKQALKESSGFLKQERHSEGSSDAASHHSYDLYQPIDRPPRDGTRSAGQSPLNFSGDFGLKRRRLDDKEGPFMYASGVWYPRAEPQLYGEEGLLKLCHKSESAFDGTAGPSGKPRDPASNGNATGPRRNDTCEFCGKVFKNCSNLTVHRRSHTGEKPYKCELCSYACAQSSKLTRHMKTHGRLGKDVYRCRFCDMPFSVPSTLEKHMRKCVVVNAGGGGSPYPLLVSSEDSKDMRDYEVSQSSN